jgi:hypothetical protein
MSDTGSESEEEVLKHMTKEQIHHCVKKSGCIMLSGRKLMHMKKDVMIDYLIKKECPELKRLLQAKEKPETK